MTTTMASMTTASEPRRPAFRATVQRSSAGSGKRDNLTSHQQARLMTSSPSLGVTSSSSLSGASVTSHRRASPSLTVETPGGEPRRGSRAASIQEALEAGHSLLANNMRVTMYDEGSLHDDKRAGVPSPKYIHKRFAEFCRSIPNQTGPTFQMSLYKNYKRTGRSQTMFLDSRNLCGLESGSWMENKPNFLWGSKSQSVSYLAVITEKKTWLFQVDGEDHKEKDVLNSWKRVMTSHLQYGNNWCITMDSGLCPGLAPYSGQKVTLHVTRHSLSIVHVSPPLCIKKWDLAQVHSCEGHTSERRLVIVLLNKDNEATDSCTFSTRRCTEISQYINKSMRTYNDSPGESSCQLSGPSSGSSPRPSPRHSSSPRPSPQSSPLIPPRFEHPPPGVPPRPPMMSPPKVPPRRDDIMVTSQRVGNPRMRLTSSGGSTVSRDISLDDSEEEALSTDDEVEQESCPAGRLDWKDTGSTSSEDVEPVSRRPVTRSPRPSRPREIPSSRQTPSPRPVISQSSEVERGMPTSYLDLKSGDGAPGDEITQMKYLNFDEENHHQEKSEKTYVYVNDPGTQTTEESMHRRKHHSYVNVPSQQGNDQQGFHSNLSLLRRKQQCASYDGPSGNRNAKQVLRSQRTISAPAGESIRDLYPYDKPLDVDKNKAEALSMRRRAGTTGTAGFPARNRDGIAGKTALTAGFSIVPAQEDTHL